MNLSDKILACYYTGIPCCIWGDPGVGKTASVEFVARKLQVHLESLISSIREPGDFYGIPYIADGVMKVSHPQWALKFKEGEPGIIFFDEISTCTLGIQAALLNVVLKGEVGEYKLPSTVYRLAASNFTNCIGNNELNPALGNRFIHIEHKVDPIVFSDMLQKQFDYDLITVVNNKGTENYDIYKKRYSKLIADFITSHSGSGYLCKAVPEELNTPLDYAYPTPRSWCMVLEVLATLNGSNKDLIKELIVGCIGVEAADVFWTKVKYDLLGKYSYKDHVNDYKITFNPKELNLDVSDYDSILGEIVNEIKLTKGSKQVQEAFDYFFDKIVDEGYASVAEKYSKYKTRKEETLIHNVEESDFSDRMARVRSIAEKLNIKI